LVGFEERCFDSRLASGRTIFATQRTSADHGAQLLHLELEAVDRGRRETLLLPDLPAERFETVINDVAAWRLVPVIERVDRLAVLLDGDRLLDVDTRWVATAQSETLLRGALETEVALPETIDVVVTKWDKVVAARGEAVAEDAIATLFATAGRVTSTPIPTAICVAARSTTGTVEPGFGLADLLERWLAPTSRRVPPDVAIDLGNRAFAHFRAPVDS
jgi:hypothetical protein